MNSFPHLTFEQLADMAEGRVAVNKDDTAHHVMCSVCAAQLARMQDTISLMRTDTAVSAPAAVLQRAVTLFEPRRVLATPRLLTRWVGILQFDSATMTPAFGVRAGHAETTQQLLFNAGPYDVDIRLSPLPGGWQVAGQVLGAGQSGHVTLQMPADHTVVAKAVLNDLLEFTLAPIAAGQYEFVVQIEQTEVMIPDITLPAG